MPWPILRISELGFCWRADAPGNLDATRAPIRDRVARVGEKATMLWASPRIGIRKARRTNNSKFCLFGCCLFGQG